MRSKLIFAAMLLFLASCQKQTHLTIVDSKGHYHHAEVAPSMEDYLPKIGEKIAIIRSDLSTGYMYGFSSDPWTLPDTGEIFQRYIIIGKVTEVN